MTIDLDHVWRRIARKRASLDDHIQRFGTAWQGLQFGTSVAWFIPICLSRMKRGMSQTRTDPSSGQARAIGISIRFQGVTQEIIG